MPPMTSASSTQRRRASTSSVDSSERAELDRAAELQRRGEHAHVVAVDLAVGEELAGPAGGHGRDVLD